MAINVNSYNTKNHNYKYQHNITILNIMSQTLTERNVVVFNDRSRKQCMKLYNYAYTWQY